MSVRNYLAGTVAIYLAFTLGFGYYAWQLWPSNLGYR